MRCTGCGKSIPFGGEVCPYCQRDKSSDQVGTIAVGIALLFGGWIGNAIGGFSGMLIGGCSLGLIAAIATSLGKGHSAKQPPKAQVQRPAPSVAKLPVKAAAPGSASDRLRRLDAMKEEGLISADEYRDQRANIIASL